MYGVSQLYQLRGRVGRSDRAAYAYLFYPRQKSLSEIAMKRLQTISDFTELGSGFKIAMKDMEIEALETSSGGSSRAIYTQSVLIFTSGFLTRLSGALKIPIMNRKPKRSLSLNIRASFPTRT